jgi:urea transport system permease protein
MHRLLVFLLCFLTLGGAALAAPLDNTLARFGSTKFDDIEDAISGLAASGEPRAASILEALADGRLLVQPAERRVYIKEPSGSLVEAATGQAAPAEVSADALKAVRVNNRIRRAVEAALGGLTLLSPDAG